MKAIWLMAAAAALAAACAGAGNTGSGSGGSDGGMNSGSGGTSTSGASSGGATGSGGMTGAGGAIGTGGNTASGGVRGSAGTLGSGGASASGGSSGAASGGRMGATGGGAAGGRAAGSGGVPATGGTSTGGSGGVGPMGTGGRTEQGGAPGSGGSMPGDAGVGDGPSGGTSGYQPCQSNPCKVLPLGDSITYGVNDEGNGGYRGPLFADIVAGGQKVTFTGSLMNGPTTVSGQSFPKRNEGHSGWGISEVTPYSNNNAGIATLIPSPAFSSGSGGTPEIILLHIGTNDATSFSAAQMQTDLKGLLDKLFTSAPNALVVLAQIIPLGYAPDNAVIKAYNQALPGIVQSLATAGKHIVLVDMNTGYSLSNFGSDNIHPSTAGYKFMADRWYAAIGSRLPR